MSIDLGAFLIPKRPGALGTVAGVAFLDIDVLEP